MSDQKKPVVFPPNPGQDQGNHSDVADGEVLTGAFLTREEAEALAQQAENRAVQRAQSLVDKSRTKMQAKLAEVETSVKRMKAIGQEVTPEQIERMKRDAQTDHR